MVQSYVIEAGEAFGSGAHPSSALALWLLGAMPQYPAPRHILDIGCGSGVLSIAAALKWKAPVVAVDIAQEAVEQTRANARANQLDDAITVFQANGCNHPQVKAGAPYDLIISNILSDVHIRLARDTAALLAPEGTLLLSGMLRWRVPEITAYYDQLGLVVTAEESQDDWVSLLLINKEA